MGASTPIAGTDSRTGIDPDPSASGAGVFGTHSGRLGEGDGASLGAVVGRADVVVVRDASIPAGSPAAPLPPRRKAVNPATRRATPPISKLDRKKAFMVEFDDATREAPDGPPSLDTETMLG
jgi:hypothetical protein